jgi:hypothetical protein
MDDWDWDALFPAPERNDGSNVRRWRGALFWHFDSPLVWKGKDHYEAIEFPHSVTFPICHLCHHVIWDWPHFEEEVPENACCEACGNEEEDQ